jgi:hypothetical protein
MANEHWYSGLTFEQVKEAIDNQEAPGTKDGEYGYTPLPDGYHKWDYDRRHKELDAKYKRG